MRHNEDNAGEHWYTFKNVPGLKEGERLDVRAYNPYASYFALAEIAKQFAQGEIQMSPKDQALALGALSVPLRGGAGFSLLDIFAGKNTDVEDIPQALKVVAGNLLAGFSVPLRTVKDFLAGFEDEGGPNRTYTDSRISPLLGPTLSNLPQLHSPLPEELSQPAYTPLAAGPLNVDRPWMKQGLGLTVDNLNLAEQESARLAIPPSALFPKTGVPEVNSAIIREMGPVAEKMMATLVQSPGYQRLDQQQQRVLFQDMLKTARSIGQASAYGKQPSLYLDTLKKSLEHPSTFAEIEMNRAFNRR
jgi:hypothetical protein